MCARLRLSNMACSVEVISSGFFFVGKLDPSPDFFLICLPVLCTKAALEIYEILQNASAAKTGPISWCVYSVTILS